MTRKTKKTPTAQSLAAHATSRPDETPKGSGPSVAPSRATGGAFLRSTACALASPEFLRAFLAARGGVLAPGGPSLEDRVGALEKVVTRLALGMGDSLSTQAEEARRRWEENGFYELTAGLNEATREAAFEEWNHENMVRADEKRAGR